MCGEPAFTLLCLSLATEPPRAPVSCQHLQVLKSCPAHAASIASRRWPDFYHLTPWLLHLDTNGSVFTPCLAVQVEGLWEAPQHQEASVQFPSPRAMAEASRQSQVLASSSFFTLSHAVCVSSILPHCTLSAEAVKS